MIRLELRDTLRRIGELRDGLIVVGTVTYIFGYVTLSAYAWRFGLATTPALDAHYFVAGAPVVLVILVATGTAISVASWVQQVWSDTTHRVPAIVKTVVNSTFTLMVALALLITLYLEFSGGLTVKKFFIYEAIAWLIMLIAYQLSKHGHVFVGASAWRLLMVGGVVALAISTIYLFVFFIYPLFPAALGGGRPRRAVLDINSSSMSPETTAFLGVRSSTRNPAPTRTRDVWVLQSRDTLMLFAHEPSPRRRTDHVEIPRSAVYAIVWRRS